MKPTDCNIIRDLLPSYIDKISSEETNELIKIHLQTCKDCNKALKDMSEGKNVDTIINQDEQIDYLKGYRKNKTISIIKAIILTIFVILVISITRKFIIITNLVNVSKEYVNKSNYLAITSSIQKDMILWQKSYNKDGNFLTEMKIYGKSLDDIITYTSYKNGDEIIGLVQKGKDIDIMDKPMSETGVPIASVYRLFQYQPIDYFKKIITSKVTTNDYNGKDCYLIESDMFTLWVDKDTGLILRQTNGGIGVTEFIYEFDVVNNGNIVKPNI